MVFYYGLPSVLAALLFASLWVRPLLRISFALVLVAVAIAIFAANLFCALLDFSLIASNRTLWFKERDFPELVKVAKAHDIEFDTRNKLEVIRDLSSRGIDAVPSIVPLDLLPVQSDGTRKSVITLDGTEVLPHGGMSNKVTVFCNESGQHDFMKAMSTAFIIRKGFGAQSRLMSSV